LPLIDKDHLLMDYHLGTFMRCTLLFLMNVFKLLLLEGLLFLETERNFLFF